MHYIKAYRQDLVEWWFEGVGQIHDLGALPLDPRAFRRDAPPPSPTRGVSEPRSPELQLPREPPPTWDAGDTWADAAYRR